MKKILSSLLTRVATSAALALAFLPATSCIEQHAEHAEEAEDHDDDDHDEHEHAPGIIIMEPEKAEAAGVETSTVTFSSFNDVIQASGKIMAASCDETIIVATTSGVVSHAQHIAEGMSISAGTTLYYVASDKLQDGDQAERARIAYLAAKRDYDRTLPLLEEHLITESEFNTIRSEYETKKVAYEAIGSNTTPRGVTVKATTSGYVSKCSVKDGDYVNVGTPLMTITRNQHLNLRVEVPMRYYSSLSKIQSAKFRTQYSDVLIDMKSINGHLMSSGKSAETTSSYVPVTFQFDNNGTTVPGAYAEVFLITGKRDGVLSVPITALTEEQGVYYVYCKVDDHSYRKQEVKLGASDGERTEVTSGLKGGESVVVKGAINVKLAGASNAIPAHNHNH
ncbi:MAG: efflux RND transporter periplasmic adaptor subunit [Muribaculaceae bacterium]|nr:efflux RND transporter periplasmic adaptor subunit [Muribaculaceae bacterium]